MEGLTGPEPAEALGKEMHSAWVLFAQHGYRGWPAYAPDHRAFMAWDTPSKLVTDPRPDELASWRAS